MSGRQISRSTLCLLAAWLLGGTLSAGDRRIEPAAYSAALHLFDARDFAKARIQFTELAKSRPDDVALNYYLGRLAWWFDDEKAAVESLERAVRLDPKDARLETALGDAYGLMALNVNLFAKFGWAKKCLAAHERAVALDPQDVGARWGLFGYLCLAPAIAGGGSEKAAAQVEAISRLDAGEGRVAACTLALSKREYITAFGIFDQVLQKSPDDYAALYQIGRCAAESGTQLGRGEETLRHCLFLAAPGGPRSPGLADVHYRLGMILEKKKDLPAAQTEYTAARRLFPDLNPDKTALYF